MGNITLQAVCDDINNWILDNPDSTFMELVCIVKNIISEAETNNPDTANVILSSCWTVLDPNLLGNYSDNNANIVTILIDWIRPIGKRGGCTYARHRNAGNSTSQDNGDRKIKFSDHWRGGSNNSTDCSPPDRHCKDTCTKVKKIRNSTSKGNNCKNPPKIELPDHFRGGSEFSVNINNVLLHHYS